MRRQGFTAIELLAAVAIAATLAALGAPAMGQLLRRTQADADTGAIIAQLRTAREWALREKADVVVCGVDRAGQCSRHDPHRFITFADANGNRRLESDETVLSSLELAFPGQIQVNLGLGSPAIHYSKGGRNNFIGNIRLCNDDGTVAAHLIVYYSARIYRQRALNQVCR